MATTLREIEEQFTCPECGGKGEREDLDINPENGERYGTVDCDACETTGRCALEPDQVRAARTALSLLPKHLQGQAVDIIRVGTLDCIAQGYVMVADLQAVAALALGRAVA